MEVVSDDVLLLMMAMKTMTTDASSHLLGFDCNELWDEHAEVYEDADGGNIVLVFAAAGHVVVIAGNVTTVVVTLQAGATLQRPHAKSKTSCNMHILG